MGNCELLTPSLQIGTLSLETLTQAKQQINQKQVGQNGYRQNGVRPIVMAPSFPKHPTHSFSEAYFLREKN